MFVNVLCTIKHFRRRKASRSVIFYCNAEAAGFEPANRLRAVNCFRGSLLQPLGHASCYFIGTLSQTISIPPTPFSRGRSGPAGFPSPLCLPCSPTPARHLMTYLNPPNPLFKGAHQAFVRTRARGHRFAVLRPASPASDDALLFIGTLSQTISIPPTPFSRGRSGPTGFPSPLCLPCPPAPARHLMMPCYFIADFTSSTYLLSQIPGPGRSSDDLSQST